MEVTKIRKINFDICSAILTEILHSLDRLYSNDLVTIQTVVKPLEKQQLFKTVPVKVSSADP